MTKEEFKIAEKILKHFDPNTNLMQVVNVLDKLREMIINLAVEEELKKIKGE